MDLFCALNTPGTVAFGIEIDKIEDIKELGDSWIYEGISDSVNENWGEFTESMIAAKILYDKKEALATKANSQVDLDDLAVEAIKEVFGDIEASFTIDDSDVELSFDIDFNEAVAVACFDSLFGWYQNHEIKISHNFDGKKFKWLYAKYAYGANPNHHCTNAIKGKYSKKFSRNNKAFVPEQTIVLDEYKELGWDAIYICGVSTKGYDKDMDGKALVTVEPPSIDQRIVNQYSFFTVLPSGITNLEDFLEENTERTVKYVIDKSLRWDLRDILDQLNMNERMIYPGKDGIAKWLARHYFVKNK